MTRAWGRSWRPLLGTVILLVVVAGVSPAAIGERLAQADLRLVIAGVLGLAAIHLVPAAGWRALLGTTADVWLPWRAALALYYAAQAIGGITPANIGGDLHRAATLRGSGHGWSASVVPLIVQRATSYLALSGLSLAALVVLAAWTPAAAALVAVAAAFAAALGVAAWLLLAPPRPLRFLHARLTSLVGGSAEPDALPVRRLGAAALIGTVSGLLFHASGVGLTWLLVVAVDPAVPAAPVLAALTVARLGLAVPFAPSGLGVQEGVLAVLFTALGLAPDVALAAMLLARLSLVVTTAIGVALLMRPARTEPSGPFSATLLEG